MRRSCLSCRRNLRSVDNSPLPSMLHFILGVIAGFVVGLGVKYLCKAAICVKRCVACCCCCDNATHVKMQK